MNFDAVWFSFLLVALLLLANAFFVAVEFALVTVRRSRVQELAHSGNAIAKTVQQLQKNIDFAIAGAQLGITLASLAVGWVAEEALHNFNRALAGSGAGSTLHIPEGAGVVISFILLSMLHVILGE